MVAPLKKQFQYAIGRLQALRRGAGRCQAVRMAPARPGCWQRSPVGQPDAVDRLEASSVAPHLRNIAEPKTRKSLWRSLAGMGRAPKFRALLASRWPRRPHEGPRASPGTRRKKCIVRGLLVEAAGGVSRGLAVRASIPHCRREAHASAKTCSHFPAFGRPMSTRDCQPRRLIVLAKVELPG